MTAIDTQDESPQESTDDRPTDPTDVTAGEHDLILEDPDGTPAAVVTISPIGDHGVDAADGAAELLASSYGPLVEER